MIPDRPNFLADTEPIGIIRLSAGRSLGDNTGKYGRLKCHILDLHRINANVLAFVGEEHGHFAAVRCRQRHEIVSGVGNGMIFLAVPVAGTVDIHPALSGKAAEMHCQPETNIQNKVSGPRLPGPNQLLRGIAGTVIVSGNCRLELVHDHFAVVIAVDDTVCHIDRTVFTHQSGLVCLYCQFRYIAGGNTLAVPDLLAVCFVQQIGIRISERGVVQADDIDRISQNAVVHHLFRDVPRADLVRGDQLDFAVVIGGIFFVVQHVPQVEDPRLVRCIRFVLVCTDIVEFQPVHRISCVQCFLVPAVSGTQSVFLTDDKRICDPLRLAPAEHVDGNIRIDCLGICGKLESGTACHVCRFIQGTLGAGLCAGGGIDICSQFQLDVCQTCTIILLKQQPHDLLIGMRVFYFIVQQQAGGIVAADAAQSTITSGRVFICLCAVCKDFHRCNG